MLRCVSVDREPFESAVNRVLDDLRPGDLTTYGEIAEEAGYPGAARAVGSLLASSGGRFPWWRVVTASGRLVPGYEDEQTGLLEGEGHTFVNGRLQRTSSTGDDD